MQYALDPKIDCVFKALPDWMAIREMKQAMSVLNTVSEKDRQYFQYQARQEYLREQRTIQLELDESRQQEEKAKQEAQASRQREEAAHQREEALKLEAEEAQAEIERLKALLSQKQA